MLPSDTVSWRARLTRRQDGFGYLVAPRLVLTARHAVESRMATPTAPEVIFPSLGLATQGKILWRSESLDAALIILAEDLPAELIKLGERGVSGAFSSVRDPLTEPPSDFRACSRTMNSSTFPST